MHSNEFLYKNAVKWIHENPEDPCISKKLKQDFIRFNELSPENKAELVITLRTLLKTTGLPEEINQSLPYLTFDLSTLPGDKFLEITGYLDEFDTRSLGSSSKRMHSLVQLPKKLLDKFLQRVAYGEQDTVERLFTDVFQGNRKKIQQALKHEGSVTDYSGRTFKCTAYEYAYWAKDTFMCRMLEGYMDEETKAIMAARIDAMELIDKVTGQTVGLGYSQAKQKHRSAHFDFTLLKEAYERFLDGFPEWFTARDWTNIIAAWAAVGKEQRNVPAHVAQEYCRTERPFSPTPTFSEDTLPRSLIFYNYKTKQNECWFPPITSDSGLGFQFSFRRGADLQVGYMSGDWFWCASYATLDLRAITRLDEVRSLDLTRSREHLKPTPADVVPADSRQSAATGAGVAPEIFSSTSSPDFSSPNEEMDTEREESAMSLDGTTRESSRVSSSNAHSRLVQHVGIFSERAGQTKRIREEGGVSPPATRQRMGTN